MKYFVDVLEDSSTAIVYGRYQLVKEAGLQRQNYRGDDTRSRKVILEIVCEVLLGTKV
jgi:hypothetical protein